MLGLLIFAVIPPAMTYRSIAPAPLPGETVHFTSAGKTIDLYVPRGWKPDPKQRLAIHFHGPSWLTFAEHERWGSKSMAINAAVGEGSTVYGKLMESPEKMKAWFATVLSEMRRRGAPTDTEIADIDLSSFSAGYGAIRQLVRQPDVFAKIRSVILCDSMYASLEPNPPRRVLAEHVEVWLPLAQAAAAGQKLFVLSVSSVPTPAYASSSECLRALVDALGGGFDKPDPSWPASSDRYYPLVRTFEKGRFYGWHYTGFGAAAHTTHVRHLADIRRAVDPIEEEPSR